MTTAKNREQYVKAWTSHVSEVGLQIMIDLGSGSIPADDLAKLVTAERALKDLIRKAADQVFGTTEVTEEQVRDVMATRAQEAK